MFTRKPTAIGYKSAPKALQIRDRCAQVGYDQAMATALASEVRHIQQVSGLSARDIAKATNVDESTVRSWLRQDRSPSGERADRLVELSAMVERLSNLLDRDYIAVWMNKPIPSLEDDKPLEVIAAGEYRRVSRVIASLEDPGAS